MSKLTLIGMKNYFDTIGGDLFLNLALPTGIDKGTVITNILLRGGEFEVLFSNPYFMRDSILSWSKKWHWTFDKWLKAINTEYNPLENYDRFEEVIDTRTDSGTSSSSHNDTRTDNLAQHTEGLGADNTVITEHTVSPYNSNAQYPHDRDSTLTHTDLTVSDTGTQTQAGTFNGASDMNSILNHESHIHGNIGVTTSQQMLQSELDVAMFNLYDKIADIFLQEFIIPIY